MGRRVTAGNHIRRLGRLDADTGPSGDGGTGPCCAASDTTAIARGRRWRVYISNKPKTRGRKLRELGLPAPQRTIAGREAS